MGKYRKIDWIFFREAKLCAWAVNEITKFSGLDRFVLWSESGHNFGGGSDKALRKDFDILCDKEPEKVRNFLCETSKWHNNQMDDFSKQYPVSISMMWESYKKYGVNIESYLIRQLSQGDLKFAVWHTYNTELITSDERNEGKSMDLESMELVEHDPSYMFNIGKYTYRDKRGNERSSIWDLGKKEVPRFMYG